MWQLAPGQITNVAALMASGLLPETQALIARFTTPPTAARADLINTLIGSLISGGVWAKLDALYVFAAADRQAAKLNWLTATYDAVETGGTVSFTANRGFTPDGVATYLETNFFPASSPSPKFTLNSAHLGAWHLTDLSNAGATSFDVGNANARITNSITLITGVRPNNVTTVNVIENFDRYKVWSRSASNLWEYYNTGSDTGGGVDASTALAAGSMQIGRTSTGSYGVNEVSIEHSGSNLTAAEVLAAYNAFSPWMTAVGAIP